MSTESSASVIVGRRHRRGESLIVGDSPLIVGDSLTGEFPIGVFHDSRVLLVSGVSIASTATAGVVWNVSVAGLGRILGDDLHGVEHNLAVHPTVAVVKLDNI